MNDTFQVGHAGWSPDYNSNKPKKLVLDPDEAKEPASAGCMARLVSRENALRNELASILKPTRGDIYANKFGTSFMLISGKKALRMTTDGIPDVRHCLKTWRDVTEDPYMSKVATVDTVLSSLGLLDNADVRRDDGNGLTP